MFLLSFDDLLVVFDGLCEVFGVSFDGFSCVLMVLLVYV